MRAILNPDLELLDVIPFRLTATTTGAAETVTITRLTTSRRQRIVWGDGTWEMLPANSTVALSHVYANAGTYRVIVEDARWITQLTLDNAKLGGLNTAELRRSPITYFSVTLITGSTVRSSDMTAWRPLYWYLYSMPVGTYNVASADMTAWKPTGWRLYSMPAGTYNIASADMTAWRPFYWRLYSMPVGTYNIASANMTAWRPADWFLYSMPAGTYTITGAEFALWTAIQILLCHTLDPALPTATVDAIIDAIWAARNNYTYASNITLHIGGTNGAPTGTVQDVCPPTTPAEKLYNLRYVQCIGDTHKTWAPITYAGGSLP